MAANLTWTAAAGASGYKIERKLTAGGTYSQIGTSTGTSFNDSGLAPGSLYFYRVRANNTVGDSAFTADIPLATPTVAPAPTNGGINSVSTSAISIRWTDNAENEDGFQIFRSVNQGPFTLLTSVPVSFAAAPSVVNYTDAGLAPGTSYDYRVQAFNLAGSSSFTSLGATTLSATPQVQTVQINSGAAQRSRVTSLTVTFSGVVNLAANAFTLTRPAFLPTSPLAATLSSAPTVGQGLIAVAATTNGLGQTVATLSFATNSGSATSVGDGVESGSLSDGSWVLRIAGAGVTNGAGIPMAADYQTATTGSGRIHRLFGDADGNATVDASDFALFGGDFGQTVSGSIFDFDNNGTSNAIDFAEFGNRFGLTL
jgi:hypothetical protein